MTRRRPPGRPYDLTLRLWSDATPLRPVVQGLGLEVGYVHVAGEPMAATGRLAQSVAKRHYASRGHADLGRTEEVSAWLNRTLAAVKGDAALAKGLRSGAIEGTCWISVLGDKTRPAPKPEPSLIAEAQALNLSVLVENYTDDAAPDFPQQTWLAGAATWNRRGATADIEQSPLGAAYRAAIEAFERDGEVPYPLRVALHDAAGEVSGGANGSDFQALFDTLLFLACAEKSYGRWKALNEDGQLDPWSRVVRERLGGDLDAEVAEKFLLEADRMVMERYYEGSAQFQNTAGLAGLSCIRALSVCAGEFEFDRDETKEIEIDPYVWDSAFLSACAIAGGAAWQVNDGVVLDEDTRHAFWRWFASDAVPASYDEACRRCRQGQKS